jgi:serine/threonine protein kinase
MSEPRPGETTSGSDDAARLERAGDIFFAVRGLGLAERDEAIEKACAGDAKLRALVMLLIRGADAPMPIEGLADDIRAAADGAESPGGGEGSDGDRIGNYRLLSRIGEGGFGVVYDAEQERPVRRRVAFKVIKLGMDTRQVVARFEAERQALALMDHPNIAKVFDAGATATGRPYFVMELVKGLPATKYCDEEKLGIRERLEIVAIVCDALQHAHQKGVIHRDIKPSNVLVATIDGKVVPKIIDFGIAKATSARLTEKTIFTEFRQMVGTPEYMSPEQAGQSAEDVDTRTDVYAIGVLLYELLTGATPFDSERLRSAAYGELLRIIREEDPPRPSTRISTLAGKIGDVAATRSIQPARLGALIRGELDWIVMRAMEKDRARRYDSAGALGADIRRYLQGEAVLAAPPSRGYQARKFVARNRGAVLATGAVGLALLAGAIGFAWQARNAQRERDAATVERNRAVAAETETAKRADELKKVSDFQAKMLAQVDPVAAGKGLVADVSARFARALADEGVPDAERAKQIEMFGSQWKRVNATDAARELIDRTILKPAIEAIDKEFKDQPVVDAALRQAIADRYGDLAMFAEALPLQERALATRRKVLGDDHKDTLSSINNMGVLLQWWGKLSEAEPYLRECLERKRRVLGDDHKETVVAIANMGSHMIYLGKPMEAEPYYKEALERSRRLKDEPNDVMINMLGSMATLLNEQGKYVEAEKMNREGLELNRRAHGNDHKNTLVSIGNIGTVLKAQGKYAEAEPFMREAVEGRRRVLGGEHPDTMVAISELEILLQAQGKLDEAEPLCREVLEKQLKLFGYESVDTLISVNSLGGLLLAKQRNTEALQTMVPAEAAARHVLAGSARKHRFLLNLGTAQSRVGEFPAAEATLIEAHSTAVKSRGEIHKDARNCSQALIDLYTAWDAAEPGKGYQAKAIEWRGKLEAATKEAESIKK